MVELSRVLVVDRDASWRREIAHTLNPVGFHVVEVASQQDVLSAMYRTHPALVILEWFPVSEESRALLFRIRELTSVPIFLVADHLTAHDRQNARRLGANALLVKPVTPPALLRRIQKQLEATAREVAEIRIDWQNHLVYRGAERISLSPQECLVLGELARRKGQPVRSEELGQTLWEAADRISRQDNVKHYIWRLRRKLEINPHRPQYLLNDRGKGYLLRFAPAETPGT